MELPKILQENLNGLQQSAGKRLPTSFNLKDFQQSLCSFAGYRRNRNNEDDEALCQINGKLAPSQFYLTIGNLSQSLDLSSLVASSPPCRSNLAFGQHGYRAVAEFLVYDYLRFSILIDFLQSVFLLSDKILCRYVQLSSSKILS